ncbi:hypothetical protein ACLEDP_00570 [Lonsdalea quercina]|uniref:hypothetical protein n=1 Tax=Lonsdalea quercina TaxID=71657 RepID=UPI0039749E49
MCKNGFDTDDLDVTLARFNNKRRNIVIDESKLKRKEKEPVTLTSATRALGSSAVSLIISKVPQASSEKMTNSFDDGWTNGSQGWGNYVNGEKMEYDVND